MNDSFTILLPSLLTWIFL